MTNPDAGRADRASAGCSGRHCPAATRRSGLLSGYDADGV